MSDFSKDHTALNISGLPKERSDAVLDEADSWANTPKRFLILVIPWLVGVIGGIWAVMANHEIALRERTIIGTIVAHEPAGRNTSVYNFSIDNKVYKGQELGSDHKTIGEQVIVYYDPANPERNRLKDFNEEALGLLGPVSFVLILSVAGIFLIVNQRRNFLRNTASQ